MKFNRIEIENFKGIEALLYEPTNVTTALIGKNGKGKTSFKEALYAGITGVFPDSCIRDGADQTNIGLVLNDGTRFTRTVHVSKANRVTVNGRTTTAKALAETLETRTGISKETAKIVSSADVLESLEPGKFSDFIMSFVPEELDYDTVLSYIPGVTSELIAEMNAIIPTMPTKFGIDTLKNAYNYFFESRKDSKRELASKEAKIAGYIEPEIVCSISAAEKRLTEILGKEAAQKSVKAALDIYKTALSNRESAELNLKKLAEQIDGIKASRPNPNELNEINAEISRTQEDISRAKTMIAIMEESVISFKNALENLNKPICPLSNALVCTTDKTAAKEEFEDLLSSNEEGIEIQKEIIDKGEKVLKNLEDKKKAYEENARAYDRKILLTSEYEKQKKNLPAVPPKPEGAVIEDYTLEKERIQKELKIAKDYEQYKEDLAIVEIFKNKVAVFNTLCKIFEPKGEVMSSIAEHYMSVFEGVANKRAKEINPEFEIKFSVEDGIEYFLKTTAKGEFRPFCTLSSGEKALCVFIILDMLNTLSNMRIMILDDLDKLDKDAFKALIELIQSKEIQDSYDHIVICAVDHEDIVNTLHKYSDIDFL